MKKTALVGVLALSMALFAGCGNDEEKVDAPPAAPQQMEEQQQNNMPDANNAAPTEATTDKGANAPENAAPSNADVTDEAIDNADASVNDADKE